MKFPLTLRLVRQTRQVCSLLADWQELCATYEALVEWRRLENEQLAAHNEELAAQVVFLSAQMVDDQRAIRQIATDARDALEAGVDIIPGLEDLIEFTNRSIANLEEHLEVTTAVDL